MYIVRTVDGNEIIAQTLAEDQNVNYNFKKGCMVKKSIFIGVGAIPTFDSNHLMTPNKKRLVLRLVFRGYGREF